MRKIATYLFPDYELLDVYGPLEMFGMLSEEFELIMVANTLEPIACRAGPKTMIDHQISDGHQYDIILVPGGSGAREAVNDVALQKWLQTQASSAELITSVCTGSALLAAAGLLTGRRATTNKMAFEWATSIDTKVNWQKQARWVKDGNIYTSSGVSAGMDMSLAIIAELIDQETAERLAIWAEYDWHQDADWDPFAKIHGLV